MFRCPRLAKLGRAGLKTIGRQTGNYPETGFDEINSDVRERDLSGLDVAAEETVTGLSDSL